VDAFVRVPSVRALRSFTCSTANESTRSDLPYDSDQLVTLTTVDPPVPVRIVGITHDHGLLRTIPERTGWNMTARYGTEDGYIDLQPDGNSFDIMMGLIKAKKGHP
jgi:hypothetical protein